MCGGIAFKLANIPKSELARVYGKEKSELLLNKGVAESKFWDQRPVLPILLNRKIILHDWGNRDPKVSLPKTGWARRESLESGAWSKYKPEYVRIKAVKGFERGRWFDIKGDIAGLRVRNKGEDRVYMITKKASNKYLKLTGHDREPLIEQ